MSDSSTCVGFVLAAATPTYAADERGVIHSANGLLEGLLGLLPGEARGRRIGSLIGHPLGREIEAVSRRAMGDGRPRRGVAMYRGCWARARHTGIHERGWSGCVVAVEPWLGLAAEASGNDSMPTDVLSSHDLGDLAALSPREAEVLWHLARDVSIPEIAHSLSRSVKTVETHVRSLSAKTGRSGRLAMTHLAIERGIAFMSREDVARVFGTPARAGGRG